MKTAPTKDKSTVTPDGKRTDRPLHGMTIRQASPHEDHRGELVEIFSSAWRFDSEPLSFIYQVTVRPGSVRGWVVHKKQQDRIFISRGHLRWAFFDSRPRSPTFKQLRVYTFSESHRVLFNIPVGVYHGVQNVGESEACFVNLPTRPYNHANPDKYRLPLNNDLIPFAFDFC